MAINLTLSSLTVLVLFNFSLKIRKSKANAQLFLLPQKHYFLPHDFFYLYIHSGALVFNTKLLLQNP
jgi:hypothetical protein